MTNPSPLQPCPYHKPTREPCGHESRCPVRIYDPAAVCTSLTIQQIALVRGWVEGASVGRDDEVPAEGAH